MAWTNNGCASLLGCGSDKGSETSKHLGSLVLPLPRIDVG